MAVTISGEGNLGGANIVVGGKLSATSFGNISGTAATFSQNVNIAGTLTYEDVTNIDSVGIITAQAGIRVTGGSVGIGTDDPGNHKLHLYGATNSDMRMTATGDDIVNIFANSNRSSANDSLLAIKAEWNGTQVGNIKINAGDDTTNKDDGYITFNTRESGAGSSAERLRVSSNGEVLIGRTTKPNDINTLVVSGASPADVYDSQIYLEGNETTGAINTGGAISFGGHDGSTARNWANIYGMKENGTGSNTASYMSFHTRSAGGAPAERLRITSAGITSITGSAAINNQFLPTHGTFANRNVVQNGDMTVCQRATSITISDGNNEGYSQMDRWFLAHNGGAGGVATVSKADEGPPGFTNCWRINVTTSEITGNFSGTQMVYADHRMVARDTGRFGIGNADGFPSVLSFYAKASNFTDKISVSVITQGGTKTYYMKSFNMTNSWKRYVMKMPKNTIGNIGTTSAHGVTIRIVLAANGSSHTYAGSDSTDWGTTRVDCATDTGNLYGSTGRSINLTGFQWEIGEEATPFEHQSFGDTLSDCQKFFCKSYNIQTDPGTVTTTGAIYNRHTQNTELGHHCFQVNFPVTMNSGAPDVTIYSLNGTIDRASDCNTGFTHVANEAFGSIQGKGVNGFSALDFSSSTGPVIGFHYTADAEP